MMTSCLETPESSKNAATRYRYDVFLSFRGEDVRKNFVDHLRDALQKREITAFRDDFDRDLPRGKSIRPELMRAIEESRYVLVIFSENYASSTWCLEELTKIVECKDISNGSVMPIFYKINPSDIRKIRGSIERDFAKHKEDFKDNPQKLEDWKAALNTVASLSGEELGDGYESQLIQKIVGEIEHRLGRRFPYAADNLVGMESRIEGVIYLLRLGKNDEVRKNDNVRSMGIRGMAGMGKTTLARAVYDRIRGQFEGGSFLANVREVSKRNGLMHLQNQLLCDILQVDSFNVKDEQKGAHVIKERLQYKKVVLILDDLDNKKQLECLAGDPNIWFGKGSRIIITTKDEHLLRLHGVNVKYKLHKLTDEESIELFCLKAFKSNYPRKGFEKLTEHVIGYCDGLPLALDVLGSYLYGRSPEEWEGVLKMLKECPEREIFDPLRISYDGLREHEKVIFLDIACFFKGKDWCSVTQILDACGFNPAIGIPVLIEKSLITIENNKLWMHDLLQDMAWKIICKESTEEPGKRSRIWLFEDLCNILMNNSGTEKLEAIVLQSGDLRTVNANGESFTNMTNLRLLDIRGIHLSSRIKNLSNKLRILTWDNYNLESFPPNFYPQNLLKLNMRDSLLKELWRGKKVFEKLKVINLSGSKLLGETPNFTYVPNLEQLILKGCIGLYEVHPSVGDLKRLNTLNLSECKNLMRLPESASNLKSLQILNLFGCSNLIKLPKNIGSLECLEELDISRTVITHLPSSLTFLKNLKTLRLHGWKHPRPMFLWGLMCTARNILDLWGLMRIARNILNSRNSRFVSLSGLSSLTKLDMSDCDLQDGEFPDDVGCLFSLESLDISENSFTKTLEGINLTSSLQLLVLNHCKYLETLPRLPESIIFVEADNCLRLTRISNPFIVCSVPGDGFCFVNCFSFLPEGLDLTLQQKCSLSLLRYIICCPVLLLPESYAVYPEFGVPEWFRFQRSGSSVGIDLPPHWFHSTWGGFMICVYFEHGSCYSQTNRDFPQVLSCCFVMGEKQLGPMLKFPIRFVDSGCTWLGYVSCFQFSGDLNWQAMSSHIDVSFSITNPRLKIEKCGVHVVYGHDPIEFNRLLVEQAVSSSKDWESIYPVLRQQPKDDIETSMTKFLIACGVTGTRGPANRQVQSCGVLDFEPGPEMPGARQIAEVLYVLLNHPWRRRPLSDSMDLAFGAERFLMETMIIIHKLLEAKKECPEAVDRVLPLLQGSIFNEIKFRRPSIPLQEVQQGEAPRKAKYSIILEYQRAKLHMGGLQN